MKMRYQLRKGKLAIQVEKTDQMWLYLAGLRKLAKRHFGRGRISEVVQAEPSLLPVGIVFNWKTGQQLGEPWKVL